NHFKQSAPESIPGYNPLQSFFERAIAEQDQLPKPSWIERFHHYLTSFLLLPKYLKARTAVNPSEHQEDFAREIPSGHPDSRDNFEIGPEHIFYDEIHRDQKGSSGTGS
ncbi:MAG: hypothetical protein KDD62_02970, partial [Bdellovibrionales bacterium]|nr:hypothetical protein [Bdellovibrionales bacterium]